MTDSAQSADRPVEPKPARDTRRRSYRKPEVEARGRIRPSLLGSPPPPP